MLISGKAAVKGKQNLISEKYREDLRKTGFPFSWE